MVFRNFALSAALLMLAAASAPAQTVIVNDLVTSSSNPVQNWSGLTKVGQSFTATSSGAISSISLNLTTSNSSSTPVYTVELWSSDNLSTPLPSTLLATFVLGQHWSTVWSGSTTQNPANVITFNSSNFTGNYSLVADTTYWLVISTTSGSAKGWGVSSTTIGDSALYNSSSWSTASLSGSLGMEIAVQSAVPEPTTYAFIGGLAALGFVTLARRRRRIPIDPTGSRLGS